MSENFFSAPPEPSTCSTTSDSDIRGPSKHEGSDLPTDSSCKPAQRVGQANLIKDLCLRDIHVAARFSIDRSSVWRWKGLENGFPIPSRSSEGVLRWSQDDLINYEASFFSDDRWQELSKVLEPAKELFLTVKQVANRYSLSNGTIWRRARQEIAFPKGIKFSARITLWSLRELLLFEQSLLYGADDRIACHALPREKERFLSDKDAAVRFSKSRQTLWRWSKHPELLFPTPIKVFPGTTRWRLSELIAFEKMQRLKALSERST